ncbi:CoA transferase [Pseudarthrobacter oxydans]|uniref:CoA transferase n=1 Tax=Pseudarthrobacter oxydans TaxID=1671 RepID=UPI003D2D9268
MSKAFDGVPQLFRNLEPAFVGPGPGVDGAEPALGDALPPWSGPRSWWGGPLDVEGLALGAVGAVAAVLNLLAGAPGRFRTTAALTAGAFDSSGHLQINGRKIQGFAPLSGFRRTQDGWIRLHANYPHHEQRLMQALGARTADGLAAALRTMTSLEAEAAIQSQGGVAAAVRSRNEWLESGMGRAAAAGPWIDWTFVDGETAGARHSLQLPTEDPRRPLGGVRVLDLTRVIAGPVSTRLLGALGADVLRIDPPRLPEITDQFVDTGFDKRSAEASLTTAAGRHQLDQLLETADVVITGYRRGSLDRFGLEPAVLLASRPELAVVSLDAWGGMGSWSGLRGFDSIVQAATGVAHLYGTENHDGEWRPGALPVQALDHATGYGVAAAAIALLARRRQTGLGGGARLSLVRTAEELFALPAVHSKGMASLLPEPELGTMASTYGELRYALPPLLVAGRPLGYTAPPVPYGSSAPAWI